MALSLVTVASAADATVFTADADETVFTADADEMVFTANAIVDEVAGTVTVDFSVENNPGFVCFYLAFTYDESVLTHTKNDYTAHESFDYIDAVYYSNAKKWSYWFYCDLDWETAFDDDGTLCSIIFDINDDVEDGSYSLAIAPEIFYDAYSNSVTMSQTNVPFAIGGDGSVTLVDTIEITPPGLTLKTDSDPYQLEVAVSPENAPQEVTWASSSASVASVSAAGLVTPRAAGTTVITATATDGNGKYDEITVTVEQSVTSVYFIGDAVIKTALKPGGTYQLRPTLYPSGLTAEMAAVTYTSEDKTVATVDADGVVTAHSPGVTFVWVTTVEGGYRDVMLICVLDPTNEALPAARVNGVSYATLDAAAAAAGEAAGAATIYLLKDQEYGGILTIPDGCSLDLNGHTLYIRQIQIAENTSVPYIGNGTIAGIPNTLLATPANTDSGTIALRPYSTLELLSDLTILHAGGYYTFYAPIELRDYSMLERLENCVITAHWRDGVVTAGIDLPGVIFGNGGAVKQLYDNTVTGTNGAIFSTYTSLLSDAHIYSGTYDSERIFTGNSTMTIYGGSFTASISSGSSLVASGYTAIIEEINGVTWYTVVKGGNPGELTVTVTPESAALALKDTETGASVTPSSHNGGVFVFDVEVGYEYEYTVSAPEYDTKTGGIYIMRAETAMSVTLTASSGGTSSGGGSSGVITSGTAAGGDVITSGGVYQLERDTSGVITIATRASVTLEGYGIDDDAMFYDLTVECSSGANLTLKNVAINNNAGKGTSSGATVFGVNILNFTGKNNTLYLEGVNLLENQDYVKGAGIHVPPGTELTFAGNGTMYFYKYSQGCGIGGNAYEACGKITFESGTYFIKGSKTGAVIGGDSQGLATNEDITISGGNVFVINMAMGAAIGSSSKATCTGNVYLTGGNLTITTQWIGSAIGPGGYVVGNLGNLFVTGGSFKPVATANALYYNYGNEQYVDDTYVRSTVYSNGKPASLFIFDTELLSTSATKFSVSGAIEYDGGLHNYVYTDSDVTMENFTYDGSDTNLYFYLPMEEDQELIVNKEKFTVSWDSSESVFTITDAQGNVVSSGTSSSTVTTEAPTVIAGEPVVVEPTVKDGKATAKADSDAVKKAVDEAVEAVKAAKASGETNVVGEVRIIAKATDATNVTSAEIEIPAAALEGAVARDDIILTLESDLSTITFGSAALKGMLSEAASNDTLKVTTELLDNAALSERQQAVVGGNLVVKLSATVGGKEVTSFQGAVAVKIPYTPPASLDAGDYDLLTVYYLDGEGNLQELKNAAYDPDAKTISFETDRFSTFLISEWLSPFGDVQRSDWFYRAVRFAYSSGIITGTTETTFAPGIDLTRAMLVTILYRYAGEPEVDGSAAFGDVEDGAWYTDAVTWASQNGLVTGYNADTFGTNDAITRAQLAVILYRYAAYLGYDTETSGDLSVYTDGDSTSDWAADAVAWAVGAGIITGTSDTTVAPNGTASRAQGATMLQRFDAIAE